MLTPILLALVLDCGTSVAQTKAVEDGGAWAHARAREISAKGMPMKTATLRDSIIIVPADDLNAPFRKPIDLEGRSLTFTRTGATGFRATAGPLSYDAAQGTRLPLDLENGVELYA